jgi:hypothetical protein
MVSFTSASLALIAGASMVAANGGYDFELGSQDNQFSKLIIFRFVFSPSLHLGRRDASSSDVEFGACQQAAATISPKPTYIIYANRTVDINGLPPVCISQLTTHNAQANIAEINKWQGWGLVLNSTAIQVCFHLSPQHNLQARH